MSGSDFSTQLLLDDRLNVTDEVLIGVEKSGASITQQTYSASSQSPTNINFLCPISSLEVIIQSQVLFSSQLTFRIDGTQAPNRLPYIPTRDASGNINGSNGGTGYETSQFCVNWAVDTGISSWALNRLINSLQITMNNAVFTQQHSELIPMFERMIPQEEASKYSQCVTSLDRIYDYRDGVEKMAYQLGVTTDVGGANDRPALFVPNNASAVPTASGTANQFLGTRPYRFHSHNNNPLASDDKRGSGGGYGDAPRGSFKIDALYALAGDGVTKRVPLISDEIVYVVVTLTEPLMAPCCGFSFGQDPRGISGFYGISNIAVNMQLNKSIYFEH